MAETVALLMMPFLRFLTVTGAPMPGAKLYSYEAGTDIPKALYSTWDGTVALPNPAVADASGQLLAYLNTNSPYKLDLFDANDVHQPGWPVDAVQGSIVSTGIFTPFISGGVTAGVGTYSSQEGTYARFGPVIFIRLRVHCTAHTGTGLVLVRGMPGVVDPVFHAPVMTVLLSSVSATGPAFAGPIVASMGGAYPDPTVEISQHNLTTRGFVPLDLQTLQSGGAWIMKMSGWYVAV